MELTNYDNNVEAPIFVKRKRKKCNVNARWRECREKQLNLHLKFTRSLQQVNMESYLPHSIRIKSTIKEI